MRSVRYSRTFAIALDELLAQGELRFGAAVIREKRARVRQAVEQHLALFPRTKQPHRELGLVVYPIVGTPFIVLYDFDDIELRVHFVLHEHSSLEGIDPASVEW